MDLSFILDRFLSWTFLRSVVDILLVAFLIYRLLLFVRGTRAQPMLMGLIIIVLVYFASQQLGLAQLTWILGNFLGSVILVVVVLFQDELRRGLVKVGLFPGFGGDLPRSLELTIKGVCEAAAKLSERRIGGLIVIRRDVGLEEYSEHAVQIDAKVSHQLLVSIFLPTSPIHDGATIIEGDRIVAAGAVLPLTFNPNVSGEYGTRHRAAIGLSERTDALIVVISEESGKISLVREGRISKDMTEKTLFSALQRLTVVRRARARRLAERIAASAADKQAVEKEESAKSKAKLAEVPQE